MVGIDTFQSLWMYCSSRVQRDNLQLFFSPICFTMASIVQPYSSWNRSASFVARMNVNQSQSADPKLGANQSAAESNGSVLIQSSLHSSTVYTVEHGGPFSVYFIKWTNFTWPTQITVHPKHWLTHHVDKWPDNFTFCSIPSHFLCLDSISEVLWCIFFMMKS